MPSGRDLEKPRTHTSGLAAESLNFLFLLCSVASGTPSLKAKAKSTLRLKGVSLLKEGRLLEGGRGGGSSALEAARASSKPP